VRPKAAPIVLWRVVFAIGYDIYAEEGLNY